MMTLASPKRPPLHMDELAVSEPDGPFLSAGPHHLAQQRTTVPEPDQIRLVVEPRVIGLSVREELALHLAHLEPHGGRTGSAVKRQVLP